MKIGIVTLPLHANYGGILQAYALQTILKRMGYQVEHIQPKVIYPKLHPTWKMPLVWTKRAFRKFLGGESSLPIFMHPKKWVRKNADKFIRENINCYFVGESNWDKKITKNYDAVVFGSDQVWRPQYAIPIEKYFGDFLGDSQIKRISYSASFGTEINEFTEEQIRKCGELLSKFSAVSVREKSGVEKCKTLFGVESKWLIDPTMLLSKEDYSNLYKKTSIPRFQGEIGVYILDRNANIEQKLEQLSRKIGKTLFTMNSKYENLNAPIVERFQPPVEQWLRAFDDAEYIITDSFHACVFSILFNKPFVCIGNKSRGNARFDSLLGLFGLEFRLVEELSDIEEKILIPIDWDRVNKILKEKRKEANEFIVNALK